MFFCKYSGCYPVAFRGCGMLLGGISGKRSGSVSWRRMGHLLESGHGCQRLYRGGDPERECLIKIVNRC